MKKLVALAILVYSFSASAMDEAEIVARLNEISTPGASAVGRPIRVLAVWGTPRESTTLGDSKIYVWRFATSLPPSYSGTVDGRGNISMMRDPDVTQGCDVIVQTDANNIIRSVTKRQLGGSACIAPVNWRLSLRE